LFSSRRRHTRSTRDWSSDVCSSDLNEEKVRSWFSTGEPNIALLTGNGVVVVDVDDPTLTDAVIEHCGPTPMKCQTPGGGLHLYYAMRPGVHYGNAVRIKGKPIDLRCENAYVVCPPSRNESGVPYRWLGEPIRTSDLPPIKVSWLRERKPSRLITPVPDIDDQAWSSVRLNLIAKTQATRKVRSWPRCPEIAPSMRARYAL